MNRGLLISDRLLETFHLVLVVFCIFGWMFSATRSWHLLLVALIMVSWVGLGRVKGAGYCPLTDLQWRLKRHLGERPGTSSFVGYEIRKLLGIKLTARQADQITETAFYLLAAASVSVNVLLPALSYA